MASIQNMIDLGMEIYRNPEEYVEQVRDLMRELRTQERREEGLKSGYVRTAKGRKKSRAPSGETTTTE